MDIIDFNFTDKLNKIYNFKDFKIVIGGDDDKNRKAVENKGVDILMSPEKTRNKDFMKYRDSGLNHVLCKLAKKNNISIGFNFNDVLKSDDRKSVLGKMMQNVRLCRKFKVKMVIISGAKNEAEMRRPGDLMSFGITIGMTPGEVKKALNFEGKD